MARPEGLEPPACWFEASRSIQLSYGRHELAFAQQDSTIFRQGDGRGCYHWKAMSGQGTRCELEVKLRLASAEQGRRLLRGTGFRVLRRRVYEHNTVFDTPEGSLRAHGLLLRLRRAGRSAVLTFKCAAAKGKYKSRQELETAVADSATFGAILAALGFAPVFRYEKYRTEYRGDDGRGIVTLDETPLGVYLELEGPPGWIDHTARLLGFTEKSYITDTYGAIYNSYCRLKGIQPRDMIFPCHPPLRGIPKPPIGTACSRKPS
jgi:adenylate cyclase class 2